MPGFAVPSTGKTTYKSFESVKYSDHRQRRSPFIEWVTHQPRQALMLYNATLIMVAVVTAGILEYTGIARKIMDASRARISAKYHAQNFTTGKSSLRFTTSAGLVAIVTTPDGRRVGDTAEGIRFNEIPDSILSQNVRHSLGEILSNRRLTGWGLIIPRPADGTYSIEFSARYPGKYHFNVHVASSDGVEIIGSSGVLTVNTNEHHRYNLNFNSQSDELASFSFMNTFYRE